MIHFYQSVITIGVHLSPFITVLCRTQHILVHFRETSISRQLMAPDNREQNNTYTWIQHKQQVQNLAVFKANTLQNSGLDTYNIPPGNRVALYPGVKHRSRI